MTKTILRIPIAGWFGVALLAFSIACVIWVVGLQAADNGGSPPPQPGRTKAAGCYGYVDVEPGVAKLYATQLGRVVKVMASDNEEIEEAGTPLFQIDDTAAQADLVRARVALRAAENDLEKAQFLPKKHEAELTAQTAAVEGKKRELEAARYKRDQAKRLSEKGVGVSKEDADAAAALALGLEQAVKAEEAKLEGLRNYAPNIELELQNAAEQVKEKKAQLEKAKYAVDQCTVRAPEPGIVLRVTVTEGDVLGPSPREPAVLFCPARPRIIRAEVEQEFAPRLFLNQTATIRDDATNSQVLHGKVTRISDWFSHRRSMLQEPLQFNDVRTLECIITLDEKTSLKIGQRVRVTLEAAN